MFRSQAADANMESEETFITKITAEVLDERKVPRLGLGLGLHQHQYI